MPGKRATYSLRIARQEDTEEEAIENLKEAIGLYFQDCPGVGLPGCAEPHTWEVEVALAF